METTLQSAVLPRHEAPLVPASAALVALGIVYGDIGTSPLYAFKQAAQAGGTLSPETILGLASLILWTLILIVSLKYAILIMRADNHGEGGIVALLALLDVRHAPRRSWRASLLIIGLIGAALLYGDGVITPAISVLSAVEGLKVDAPALAPAVVPLSIVILVGLFLVQRKGTAFIGNIFGPLMLLWFVAIGVLGMRGIFAAPAILEAVSPHCALLYLVHAPPGIAFAVLGAVFLAVTGGEAMYADMGHFGRLPIRLGWFAVVLPALVLNYFGQGALLLADPRSHREPVLPARPGMAALPDGGVCHRRHDHCLAGHHLRRVLTDPASDPAGLSAAAAGAAHRQPRKGPDLYADGELAARRRHARRRDHVRLLRRARRRLRHRRVDADGDHHGAGCAGRPAMGLQPAPRHGRQRLSSCSSTWSLSPPTRPS